MSYVSDCMCLHWVSLKFATMHLILVQSVFGNMHIQHGMNIDQTSQRFSFFVVYKYKLKWLLFISRKTINIFLCITQLGFCCVYFVFVAVNLQEVVEHYFVRIDIRVYLLIILIPMIMLNFLKNLKYLAPVSLFASFLTVVGKFFF